MSHALLTVLTVGAAGLLSAQAPSSRTLDRGSLTISINGQRAGREDFTISGTPGANGMEYLSKATVVMGDRRLNPSLWADSTGAATRYLIETRGTSGAVERWMGGITRGRVSASITNARGPSEREYVVAEGAVILEDDVFHQFFFVAQRASSGSVPVVVPLRNRQLVLKVTNAGADKVTIGGASVDARHLIFTEPSGDAREVWVDASGRVLRVAIPSRNLVAVRDEPPAG
jgi:hypothetical protein